LATFETALDGRDYDKVIKHFALTMDRCQPQVIQQNVGALPRRHRHCRPTLGANGTIAARNKRSTHATELAIITLA
jgi:hypothetical protein